MIQNIQMAKIIEAHYVYEFLVGIGFGRLSPSVAWEASRISALQDLGLFDRDVPTPLGRYMFRPHGGLEMLLDWRTNFDWRCLAFVFLGAYLVQHQGQGDDLLGKVLSRRFLPVYQTMAVATSWLLEEEIRNTSFNDPVWDILLLAGAPCFPDPEALLDLLSQKDVKHEVLSVLTYRSFWMEKAQCREPRISARAPEMGELRPKPVEWPIFEVTRK